MSLFFDIRQVEHLQATPSFGASLKLPPTRTKRQYSHWIFNRYPARSVAEVPRCIIRSLSDSHSSKVRVLDPFMGSGTTAVETVLAGGEAFGVEADPFARLVATVRTTRFSGAELEQVKKIGWRIEQSLCRAGGRLAEPADIPNLEYWFPHENIQALRRLRFLIDEQSENERIRNFFLVVMAECIRPCSFAERQTLKPYISKRFPKKPFLVQDMWSKHLRRDLEAIWDFSGAVESRALPINWIGTDATQFSCSLKVDVAITSPPYVNALDYVRCTKLESAWVGLTTEEIRAKLRTVLVGETARTRIDSVPQYQSADLDALVSQIATSDQARAAIVRAYFNDLARNLDCMSRVIRAGGTYWIIVGENEIRGTTISTHLVLASIAPQLGFSPTQLFRYVLRDHRTSIPRQGRGGKMEYEYVLGLTRVV